VRLRHIALAAVLLITACGYVPGKAGPGAEDCSRALAVPVIPQGNGYLGYYEPGGYPLLINEQNGPVPYPGFNTWKWSCGQWIHLAALTVDSVGWMAYEPHLRKTLMLGRKFRAWDGAAWADLPYAMPTSLGGTHLTFDQARDQLLLFDASSEVAEMWTFQGTKWIKLSTTGPKQHFGAGFAYDPRSRTSLLFGGECSGGFCDFGDTWSWDGQAWTELHPIKAPPAGPAQMAFDAGSNQMILLTRSGTWAWDGTNWAQLQIPSPPFPSGQKLIQDSVHKQLFLFEGAAGDSSQTWIYKAGKWTQLAGPMPSQPASSSRTNPTPSDSQLPMASGARLQSPAPLPGAPCRLPYADISEASGGFITLPGGEVQSDPAATVALPGGTPGRVGQNPGLTYLAASKTWVPVPMRWVSPSGKIYAYQWGNKISAVKIADRASIDVTTDGGWALLAPTDSGAYVTKPGIPGAWFVPYGGSPKQIADHGRWDAYSQGVLWGFDDSSNLLRLDVSSGSETTWGKRQYAWIPGFDDSAQPFVVVMGVMWLAHADGSFTQIWPGGNELSAGYPVVTDARGSWFAVGGGRVGAPGHGIYLWTKTGGAKFLAAHDVIIAGPCL
jgi:hypothetical protein